MECEKIPRLISKSDLSVACYHCKWRAQVAELYTTGAASSCRAGVFHSVSIICVPEQYHIRKVLRPANSINVFRGFPWFQSNAVLVLKFHVTLYASHAALPMVISKFRHNSALLNFYFQ
jgi:hypothetical protein